MIKEIILVLNTLQKEMLPNLACVLMNLLFGEIYVDEDGFKDLCPENFVKLSETYPWRN